MPANLSSFVLALVSAVPALAAAQPAPAPPPPPAPAATYELAFSVMDFSAAKPVTTRTHSVFVLANDCGQMAEEVGDHADEIRACTRAAGGQLELVVDWKTRNGIGKPTVSTYTGKQSLAIARGKTYAFGGNRDATLWLQVK